MRKFLKRSELKIYSTLKGNSQSSPRGAKSPTQDKPKEKHDKTHTNQTNRLNTKTDYQNQQGRRNKYKGNPICLTANCAIETLHLRREWQDIFKVLKGKNLQSRLQYPARI